MIDQTFLEGYIMTAGGRRLALKEILPSFWDSLNNSDVYSHFSNPQNHHTNIMATVNHYATYDRYLKGRSNLVFMDLGANIGIVSIHASDVCSTIVSVEPHPDFFGILQKFARQFPQIKPVHVAVADRDGVARLSLPLGNPTMASIANTYTDKYFDVHCKRLCTIIAEQSLSHVDLCKVDIEGGELRALNFDDVDDCKDIIQSYHVETHCVDGYNGIEVADIITKRFIHAGYSCERTSSDVIYAVRKGYP